MIDWTRLLAESFRQFMTEEGIDSSTLKDKLSPELLKRFLEKFIGTADPDQLRRQLADAPGAVGFFISFMLALPAEGRFASVLILSEIMKAAGLPIPPGVRTAVIAAFEATGEVGVTDEDIRRYRSRVLDSLSGISPGMALAAGAALAGAAVVAALSSRNSEPQIEPAPPVLEDNPMSTPPDPTDPSLSTPPPVTVAPTVVVSSPAVTEPPEPTDPNKLRFLEFLASVKLLREAEVIELPRRPTEYWLGVEWVRKHRDDKNVENRRKARRVFDLLPVDLTEVEREKLKKPIDELFKVRGPRTKRPTEANRRDYAEQVHVMFNRASAWEAEVREIGREQSWFWRRLVTIPLADKLDDMVNDDVRGTIVMLAHLAIIILSGLVAYLPLESNDFVEQSGMIRLALCGGLIGASLYTLIKQAFSHSEIIDKLYTGKNLDGSERDRDTVEVLGSLGMTFSLIGGTILLAGWLAPGFTPLTFALNCCLFGVWGAAFAALINDPWANVLKDVYYKEIKGKDGSVTVVLDSPVVHHAEDEHTPADAAAKDHPKADDKHGKKDDKPHGKDHGKVAHAPTGSIIGPLVTEKQEKLKLVVPGIQRPGVLKTSMGATLVGFSLNLVWALTAVVTPFNGLFVAAFFFLLTILTVSQYFNALVTVEWMQGFIKTTLGQGLVIIIALFVLAFGMAALFSDRGQVRLVKSVHATTDSWFEEPETAGVSVTKSKPTAQTYVSTTTVTRSRTCTEREWLEEQSAGFCARNPSFIGCKCE